MSLTEMKLESNSKIRIDFGGGNLSSDGGLLLMKKFLSKIGFERLAAAKFKTIDGAKRFHSDVENLMQVISCKYLYPGSISDAFNPVRLRFGFPPSLNTVR